MNTWPKKCPCCPRSYTRETWTVLPFVGEKALDDGEPVLQYRNCSCGSTLAIVVESDVADEAA